MPTSTPPAAFGPETARILLDIGAVDFRPEEPYTLTSGWASPVYIDCRKLISYPAERRRVIEMAVTLLRDAGDLAGAGAVAGGETAGIPYAAWIAEATGLPMLYVRKKPKGFGRDAQIEGDLEDGQRVILIEDLATDGSSKLVFIDALRRAGAEVGAALVIFYYGVFPGALGELEKAGVALRHLADWQDVLEVAGGGGYFTPEAISGVREFLADPVGWSASHGGRSGA